MKKIVKVSAPGKIIIHGEHAVVYDRAAFAGCINKRLHCTIEKVENSDEVCFNSHCDGKFITQTFKKSVLIHFIRGSTGDIRSPFSLATYNWDEIINHLPEEKRIESLEVAICRVWIGLVLSIACNILSTCDYGLSIEICSELPYAAGLGSSASLSSCIAAALLIFFGIITPIIVNVEGKALQYKVNDDDLKLVSDWAFEAEKLIHGTPSGIDNNVITFGGTLLYREGKMDFLKSLPAVQILLVNTGVSRKTSDIVAGVRSRYNKIQVAYDAVFDAMQKLTEESVSNLLQLQQALQDKQHEDQCNQIYDKIIMFTEMNQHLLRAIGVSHQSIDDVIDCLDRFKFKGKLTGAGGGGCVFAFIKPGTCQSVIDDVKKDLLSAGYESWITQLGCHGITCHSIIH